MGTITILRPSATSSGVGWSAVPSGTLDGVTSDDSDVSYALWSGSGSALILATPVDTPPAGERRHQVRLRIRGKDGDVWGAVRLASGALVAGAAATLPAAMTTVAGSWGFGAPPDGSTVLSTYITGQTTSVKVAELYLDMDSREAPSFTPQVIDGSGTVTTTVADTTQPTLLASSVDLDALQPRQYRYWVTLASVIVWDTGIVSGPADTQQTTALDNGSYVAHYQVWSTLGSNTAYASDEETVSFTVSTGLVPAPDNPDVSPVDGTPFYELEVCAPYAGDFDNDQAWIEIQRVDCDSSTTVAILGPLETAECATYTDYTHPRTGIGVTCDHDPDPCCSYYRARTLGRVSGQLQISNWSDAFDPGVPNGLIFFWPSTAASIPAGWNRATELDSKYAKGVATSGTAPGTTGGAATHTHTTSGHTHDESHAHTMSANTSAAVGTVQSGTGAAGTTAVLSSHTHTVPATTNTPTVASGSTQPAIDSVANDPDRLAVIHIRSNGQPLGVPANALGISPDSALTGWTDYANATGRFLKGAGSGADGGATAASVLNNHTHAVSAHTHTGTAHSHTATSGSVTSDKTLTAGAVTALWQTPSHSHPIVSDSTATATLSSGGSGTSGASSLGATEPPFVNTRVKQNTSGVDSLPVGLIGLWRGSLGSIPRHWALCDGTGGKPNLLATYPKGATSSIGTTGGSLNPHNHTSPSHTHTTGTHSHAVTVGPSGATSALVLATTTVTVATPTHTHTHGDTAAATPTVSSVSSGTLVNTTTEPPFEEVAFVQLTETPTPPPAPEEFCLDWDDNEHLLRTEGPDGPLWAAVGGIITWDKDRPFTAATGVMGGRFVTSAAPGGRNLHMTTAVESEAELATLKAVLNRPLVLVSPSDSAEVWAAPVASSVRIIKVGRIRQVSADFIATGPQPPPQLADVGS